MNPSHTEREMLESKEICANFDFNRTKNLAQKIGTKRIIFSGMGSSLIFPGKQAKHRALLYNLTNRIEVYFSSDLLQYNNDFSDTVFVLCSNSGNTKEVLLLLEHAKARGAMCVGITAVADSPLTKRCDEVIILFGGLEKGVAATKSVVEQALICDSLIFHLAKNQGCRVDFPTLAQDLIDTGNKIYSNANLILQDQLLDALANSPQYFFVGLDTGVAEEIALKAQELAHKLSVFYPATQILHGPAETIQNGTVILFESSRFIPYITEFDDFIKKTYSIIIGIDQNSPIAGVGIAINPTFQNYCLLSAGWGLLRNIGNNLGIDFDHPQKIAKISVPYLGHV